MAREQIHGGDQSRGRPLVARLVVVIASLVASLAVSEVAVRIWAPKQTCLRFTQDVNELKALGIDDSVVENDPELFWRLAPNQNRSADGFPFRGVISNSQGLRADHGIPPEKPPGEIRILFLGDSCTFGYGLLHTETFVYQVEQMLRTQFPNVQLQCINAGVPGYTLFQGLRLLETQGSRYHADLVVANFGFNDASQWDNRSDMEHHRQSLAAQPIPGLRWSRLFQMAWGAASQLKPGNAAPRARLIGSEFFSLLTRLNEVAGRQGSGLLLLALPYEINIDPRYPPNERLESQTLLITYGSAVLRLDHQSDGIVDLVPILQDMAKKQPVSELLIDSVHAKRMVNEHYARAIVAKLGPWVESRLNGRGRGNTSDGNGGKH